jgi:hypothetical protein
MFARILFEALYCGDNAARHRFGGRYTIYDLACDSGMDYGACERARLTTNAGRGYGGTDAHSTPWAISVAKFIWDRPK